MIHGILKTGIAQSTYGQLNKIQLILFDTLTTK